MTRAIEVPDVAEHRKHEWCKNSQLVAHRERTCIEWLEVSREGISLNTEVYIIGVMHTAKSLLYTGEKSVCPVLCCSGNEHVHAALHLLASQFRRTSNDACLQLHI
jgi:hypothetical protein